ncbi:hypothetical protein [Parasphingorhabdus sp.]|uniref:hypothetical protein n=1 Tax=Parasphingorhabdus sp. TaxID=2709688 RepID=UPI003A94C08F
MTGDDMNNINLQSLMSLMVPAKDESVSMFIATVAKALSSAKDRVVADTMGVTPATIANWKRRNSIPEENQEWFKTTLVEKIVSYNRTWPRTELEARIAFLRLLERTNGDPYDIGEKGALAVANSMPGLLSLSQFLIDRMYSVCADEAEITTEAICDLLIPSMFIARNADHIRVFRH